MNATLFNADAEAHCKIIALGLLGGIVVVWSRSLPLETWFGMPVEKTPSWV